MNRSWNTILITLFALAALIAVSDSASADQRGHGRNLRAEMDGSHEVPAISTTGTGEFEGRINRERTQIEFVLSWEDLQGGNVLFAHLHLAQKDVNGGIIVFLCGGGGQAPCENSPSGSASGTITPENVQGPSGQGITEGEFAELLRAVSEGIVYVNLHTELFPGGEIRGQVR